MEIIMGDCTDCGSTPIWVAELEQRSGHMIYLCHRCTAEKLQRELLDTLPRVKKRSLGLVADALLKGDLPW